MIPMLRDFWDNPGAPHFRFASSKHVEDARVAALISTIKEVVARGCGTEQQLRDSFRARHRQEARDHHRCEHSANINFGSICGRWDLTLHSCPWSQTVRSISISSKTIRPDGHVSVMWGT
jgi:hypothetical protein